MLFAKIQKLLILSVLLSILSPHNTSADTTKLPPRTTKPEAIKIPPHLIGYELDQCDKVIKKYTGSSVRYFRPPGGDYNGDVIHEAAKRGYITSLWTDDPGDYARPPKEVINKRTIDPLEDGAILLLYDGIPETIEVLPEIIKEARRLGYEFVTINQLAMNR